MAQIEPNAVAAGARAGAWTSVRPPRPEPSLRSGLRGWVIATPGLPRPYAVQIFQRRALIRSAPAGDAVEAGRLLRRLLDEAMADPPQP